jgi:hypothetical protein
MSFHRVRARARLLVATGAAVAMIATTTAVVAGVVGANPGPFTACLSTKQATLYNVAVGASPSAACKGSDTMISFSNGAGSGGGAEGVVVAAGRAGPTGGLTTPPQFGTTGLAVDHLAGGIYRLSFPGYDQTHRYVVGGSPVTSLADAPRLLETVVDGGVSPTLDPSLGLYVRISTINGTAVDSTFTFQVIDYSAAP